MAKITHKGSWIKISSLNKEDKKIILFLLACSSLEHYFGVFI